MAKSKPTPTPEDQSPAARRERFFDGSCPIHGRTMDQCDGYYDDSFGQHTYVGCPKGDCDVRAIAYSVLGPWKILPEYEHLIGKETVLAAAAEVTAEPSKKRKSKRKPWAVPPDQSKASRLERLRQGACPIHSAEMEQCDDWFRDARAKVYTIVRCRAPGCAIKAKMYSTKGPWTLLPSCKDLLEIGATPEGSVEREPIVIRPLVTYYFRKPRPAGEGER